MAALGEREASRAIVVFLNGAFGIGKTTVARILRAELQNSALFDPEWIGFVQRRVRLALRRPVDDFQDLPSWRRWSVRGIRLARARRSLVLVPMAFTNLDYLNELRAGVARFEPDVRHLCLVAPLAVVEMRVAERLARADEAQRAWVLRRAAECCAAHARPEFAEHVPTEGRNAREVANAVRGRLIAPRGSS